MAADLEAVRARPLAVRVVDHPRREPEHAALDRLQLRDRRGLPDRRRHADSLWAAWRSSRGYPTRRAGFARRRSPTSPGLGLDELDDELHRLVAEQERHVDEECVVLYAGTNALNPRVARLLASTISARPNLGHPGDKLNRGMAHAERLEVLARSRRAPAPARAPRRAAGRLRLAREPLRVHGDDAAGRPHPRLLGRRRRPPDARPGRRRRPLRARGARAAVRRGPHGRRRRAALRDRGARRAEAPDRRREHVPAPVRARATCARSPTPSARWCSTTRPTWAA